MMHTKLIHAAIALGLLLPGVANAYVSPEEVFFYSQPPSPREVNSRILEQQAKSAERRQAELDKYYGTDEEDTSTETDPEDDATHGSAGDLEDVINSIDDKLDDLQKTDDEKRLDRLLDRLDRMQDNANTTGEVLHSGAPLADTGMGTIIGGIVLMVAAVWTMWHAMRQSRQA